MKINQANRLNNVQEYYFSSKLREVARSNQSGADIINLGIGSPDLPPAPEVIAELNYWAEKDNVHGYQSYTGLPELRSKIAEWLKARYHVEFNEQTEILPLMGSKEGIMHVSMAFLNPGDKVLAPNPGYPTYTSVTKLVEAEVIEYNLDAEQAWGIDFDHLNSLPLDEVKLMWVNYPHMPSGAKGTDGQFSRLIGLGREYGFLVVNDNPYGMLYTGKKRSIFQNESAKDVCLELNSLSKSHNMAGWRLGWVAGHEDYIKAILKVKSNMDSGMFLPIQKAAIKALELSDTWYSDLNAKYKERRQVAFQILQALECTFDSSQEGLFVWGKIPAKIKSVGEWVDHIIHEARVFLTPGFIFGTNGARYIRISLCADHDLLSESLKRIEQSNLDIEV